MKPTDIISKELQERYILTIRKVLDEKGWTQAFLANESQLGKDTVNRILGGRQRLTPNTLQKLSNALGLNSADFDDAPDAKSDAELTAFVEYGGAIRKFTSFNSLENWIKKTKEKAKSLPVQAKGLISLNEKNKRAIARQRRYQKLDIGSIVLDQTEEYDATSQLICAFRRNDDEMTVEEHQEGFTLNLGNMINKFPFTMDGVPFYTSESAYICGMFSTNSEKDIEVQKRLVAETNGYAAKKDIRGKYEAALKRSDWESFNIQWMLYIVWKKTQNNADFQNELLRLPDNALIVENSAFQKAKKKGDTRAIWGCTNEEMVKAHNTVQEYCNVCSPEKKKEFESKLSDLRYIGTFKGKNLMGKILMLCREALKKGTEPPIDYDLLRSKNIYLLGKRLTFDENTPKTIIFDFDGTLLDTRPWQEHEHLFKKHKRGSKEWKSGRKEYLSYVKDCRQWEGMNDVLDFIRKRHLCVAIVSANTKDRVVAAIKEFGWEDIIETQHIFGCYSLGLRRVSKENGDASLFKKAFEVLNASPEECVAFGNELNDTIAARNCGIKAYNCLWGAKEEEAIEMRKEMPNLSLSSPLQIIDVLN